MLTCDRAKSILRGNGQWEMKDRKKWKWIDYAGFTSVVHDGVVVCMKWDKEYSIPRTSCHVGGNGSRSGKRNESDRLPKLVPVIWEEGATRHRKDEGR